MAIPLLVAGGLAVAGAAGGAAALAAKAGKNERRARSFYDSTGQTGYDKNASLWGGKEGGLQQYEQQMNNAQRGVENRGAFQANYDRANAWEAQNFQARQGQDQMALQMMQRARGEIPSIAGQQAALDTQRAIAAQQSQAASARGAGGIALAQQAAANNAANVQAQISNNAQINAANERMQAEQAAFGAYSGMRGGDAAQQGMSTQQAQFQTQMEQANRQANDQRAAQYEQLKFGANQAQLNSQMQNQAILGQSFNSAESANQQTAQANANNTANFVNRMIPSDEQMKQSMDIMSLMKGGQGSSNGNGSDVYNNANKSGDNTSQYMQLAGMAMKSDTRAKEAALLAKGRAQGAAQARGQYAVTRDDVNTIKYGSWSGDADPAMLDDRERQLGPGAAEDVTSRAALHSGIEAAIADRRASSQRAQDEALTSEQANDTIRDDAAMAQWERSFGSADVARNDARMADNHKEMQKIRAGFGDDKKETPWYMTDVSGLFGGTSAPNVSGLDVYHGGNVIKSDDRAKLRDAFQAGVLYGEKTLATGGDHSSELPTYARDPKRDAEMKEKAQYDQNLRDAGAREQRGDAPKPKGPVPRIAPTIHPSVPMGSASRPDAGPLADANRKMRGEPYIYRPGHVPPHEQPGQPHFGFMAQHLEQNPISATAVEEGPDGMKRVDRDRMLQVMASGISDLQRQQDEMRLALGKGRRKVA